MQRRLSFTESLLGFWGALVFHRPSLTYSPPARKPGSFGVSWFGQVLEWITATWFRFGAFLIWVPLVLMILLSPFSVLEKIAFMLLSPVAACFYLILFRVVLFCLLFLPKIGPVAGWLRIAYYSLFSRLVCQQAPSITTPAWFGRSQP